MEPTQQPPSNSQKKTQELSERRAALFAAKEVLRSKKFFIFALVFSAILGVTFTHTLHVPKYQANSSLFVQALADPTAAAYLLNQQIGRSNKADRIETYIRYLSSDQFYLAAARRVKYSDNIEGLNFRPPGSTSVISLHFWKAKIKHFLISEKARQRENKPPSIDEIASFIRGTTTYETDYSHFIQIHSKTLDPKLAQIIANSIAEEFVDITNRRGHSEIDQIQVFVEEKIKSTKDKLADLEIKLIDFKKKHNIISTEASSIHLSERYTTIAKKLEAAQINMEENKKLIGFFEKGQVENLKSFTKESNPSRFGDKETLYVLQRKLQQLKRQKSMARAQQGSNQTYRIKQINAEILKTASVLKKYASSAKESGLFQQMNPQRIQLKIQQLKEENEVLKRSIQSHKSALSGVNNKIKDIPFLAQKQFVLENNLKLETENFSSLKNKLSELEIQKISQKKEVRVDQVASLPGPMARSSFLLKALFAFLAASALSVFIILGLETVNPTVKHRSDLEDCGLDFIGDVPLVTGDDSEFRKPAETFGTSSDIVCLHRPESLESMAFKYIRARIESLRYKQKKNHQVISISSSTVNEGKSFVAANLAVSLSQLKRSVILIDGDLRRPSQNVYFEIYPKFGMVDVLDMKKSLDDVLIRDVTPHLDYLPAGFCGDLSTEYIASEKFRAFIDFLSTKYDYIVIDTPPTFAAVDAAIVASLSDIPVLITNFRETKKSDLIEAYNQMLQVSFTRVFGIINKAILSTTRFHYYGYHSQPLSQEAKPSSSDGQTSSEIDDFLDNLNKKSS